MLDKYTMIYTVIILLSITTIGMAQNHEVTGTVTDAETGESLPGVNIIIQGTSQGTTTDLDGEYEINTEPDGVLVFSYVGYERTEVPIEGREVINISLNQASIMAGELVVIGYGAQQERQITGAISSVNMEEVNNNLPNTNITQSLSNVSGVLFKGDGRPGQGGQLLIRGQNSLSANTDPLIVLDGIIFSGDISDINPHNIESMEVLKDASSTAIYGSRAANGVILVTSKGGGTGTSKPTINVNLFTAFSEEAELLNLISPERYLERRLDWREQSGLEADPSKIADYLSPDEAENYNAGISRSPWDVASRTGRINSMNVSVAGRTDNLNYFISSSYDLEEGLLIDDDQEKINLRGNFDIGVTDWLNVGTRTTYTSRDRSGVPPSLQNVFRNSPYGTFFHPDGEPRQHPVSSERASTNVMYGPLLTTNDEVYNNLFSNLYAILDKTVWGGNLSYRVNYSPNLRWDHDYNYVRQDTYREVNTTSASKFNRNSFKWELENILSYDGQINENNSFDVTLLYGRRHSELEFTNTNAGQLELDGLGFDNLSLGSNPSINSYAEEVDGVSYMGRINYQFKDRYLFTLTARRDGSSVFAANHKYAILPSGAFAWIISDESFMDDVNAINFLKIRLSHGSVGNEAIQPYQSLTLDQTTRYIFGGNNPLGVITSRLGNEDLKWETTTTTNAAIDFELFEGRFGGALELYNSDTNDLLVRRSIPIMGGFDNILTNIGEVNNRGIELSLNSHNIQSSNFSWRTSISASYNRNRIVHLFGTDLDGDGREDDSISNSWFIGEEINSYYDYEFDGIYQQGDPNIPQGFQPGDVKVKDLNGDGVINADDRKVVGSGTNPKYQFGLTNRFGYKNFELSVVMNAMLGWKGIYDLINPIVPGRAFGGIDNNWWTSENQSNSRPSLVYTNTLDTHWYFNRNFFRVRDISLSYEFNQSTLSQIGLTNLRLYLSAKNLLTITDWIGSDPESANDIETLQGPGSDGAFPLSRTVAFGISLGL
ncbi:SusC/RagA family TonB-linked outer membrane protein [Rhodohalobacter sulfatireducens]|uniref:SusC/RagA family TonB-linked outer membrane protein n=1 Tax=Rhodohalobacter sulfatireducens TaxID=2911366 RepID=A0ABS9KAE2_9BACT|nr:SusC/RagA family TonB-linked outer membrane protein [Rhodohalobacter sulfatireducens]MCG2587798.1 SusC/RagA family TonB-linked outer membrane protein [Rhodohalobacter sulfatireducens]